MSKRPEILKISIGPHSIVVELSASGGSIASNLHDPDDDIYDSAIDALESLILAHAVAGVNVLDPKYKKGIETAIEAIANNTT